MDKRKAEIDDGGDAKRFRPAGFPGFPPPPMPPVGPVTVPLGPGGLQFAPPGGLAQRPVPKPGESNSETRSLYVGNLNPRVQESLLYDIFSVFGPVEGVKIIKDKVTNEPQGYGFVDYFDHNTAQMAMTSFNGKLLYGNEMKVNWAQAGGQKEDTTNHFHIFVGDLSGEIDDKALHDAFSAFGSISDARIMTDPVSGRSRGYGFIAFRKKEDAQRALSEMNGEWLGNRAIRCNWANQKGQASEGGGGGSGLDYSAVLAQTPPANTTVYVGNITPDITELTLRSVFAEFGFIDEVKMQADKGFAFVRFSTHEIAARAICAMHGKIIGSRAIKASWGKEKAGGVTPMVLNPGGVPMPPVPGAMPGFPPRPF